jgi:hypothetical protein
MPDRLKRVAENCMSRIRPGLLFIPLFFCGTGFSGPLQAAEVSSPSPAAATVAPVAGVIYQDLLIDPGLDGQLFAEELYEQEAEPEGRRFLSLEYQHYRERQDPDDLNENGLLLNGRRETRDYGEFDLQAAIRRGDHQPLSESSGSGRVFVYQYGFALDEKRVMDNTLGVLRSSADPMLTSSFRLNLPSTLLAGGQTRVTHDEVSTLYASAGRIGQLDSGQIQGFDLQDGEQYALGYSRKLDNKWRAGAHLVSVNGSENTRDHQSVVTALQYEDPGTRDRYISHALVDSNGQYGLWLDGDNRIHDWRYRYGVFRLEPGLLWSDSTPANDQQGVYLRTETQRLRYNVTAGLEAYQNDIDRQSGIAGANFYNGFVNGTWRMTRKTSVGGTLNLRDIAARDVQAHDSHAYTLSGFVSHAFPVGRTRLQLQAAELEQSGKNGNAYEIIWDQDWDVSRDLSLSTSLSHATENGLDENVDRSEASLLVRHNVTSELNWNGDISYAHLVKDSGDRQNTFYASLALGWNFFPHWDVSVRATYNKADVEIAGISSADIDNDATLLLNLRYSKSSGRSFTRIGNDTDNKGYGSIAGTVFFDDNGDGRRQAGERVAVGVFVYLDRRYQAVTDSDGRYVFDSVPSGKHAMTLAEEDLPLPWGLLNESVFQVQVDVRKSTTLDFGLRRINE